MERTSKLAWRKAFTLLCALMTAVSIQANITVTLNRMPLKKAFKEIEKVSDLHFIYKSDLPGLNSPVTLSVKNESDKAVLDKLFAGTPLKYRVKSGNTIVVYHQSQPADADADDKSTADANQAGTLDISGKVVDNNGEPLVGATVIEKGTKRATMTDIDGNFRLSGVKKGSTVTVSYVGYDTNKFTANNSGNYDVKLKENTTMLDDVVVVGYGVQKKVNLTGSVSSIDFTKEVEGRPMMNVSTALAGLAPGVQVSQTSGQPGSDGATIRIRGNGTFNTNSPLVLVDGIEWSMDDVNPNDIENISILKDAASTAIYGTRAANGVILITTKKGSGKAHVTYSYTGVVQKPYNDLSWVNNYADYMGYINEGCDNMGQPHIFSDTSIQTWRDATADPYGLNEYGVPNYAAYPNTDWFREIFRTSYSQRHNVSVSGSSEKIKYLISFGYLDNQGVMNERNLDSSTQKFDFRTNLEAQLLSWLKIGTRIYGQKQDYGVANISNGFNYLYQTTPGIYPGEPDHWGVPALQSEESSTANNIFQQMAGGSGSRKVWRLNGSLYGIFTPMKGLSFEATLNYSPTFENRESYSRPNGRWDYVTDTRYSESALENATVTNSTSRSHRQSIEVLGRYFTTIKDKHDLGVLLGYSNQTYFAKGFGVSRKGAADWSLSELSTYEELTSSSSSAAAKWGLVSYFGRVNYAFDNRYLFEANLRADASSRFGQKGRWGYFPSFSAGWRINEEKFMEPTAEYLSNLKLRASWGKTGNNSIGNYDWQAIYNTANVVVDGSGTKGLIQKMLGNDRLQWETTTTTDIGLDFGFFNNRLTGSIDFYNKQTSGILYHPELYLTMGFVSSAPANLGEVRNRGLEFELNWRDNVGKDFSYNVGVNFGFNTNKILKFKGQYQAYWEYDANGNPINFVNNFSNISESKFDGYLAEGKMLGETYFRHVYHGTGEGYTGGAVDIHAGPRDGMIRTPQDLQWAQAMIDSGYSFCGITSLNKDQLWYGDLIYEDINGDGNYGNDNDRVFSGHSNIPKINLGINIAMAYKGFDFSMTWAGAFGHYLCWRTDYYNSTKISQGYAVSSRIAGDHYFFDPQNPTDPRTNINGKYPRLTFGTTLNNNVQSDWNEYKADYLKLKNVQLGYTLPQSITRKFFVDKLRFFVSLENVLTITDYPGQDPEIGTAIGYPLMRQFSFGGQITF